MPGNGQFSDSESDSEFIGWYSHYRNLRIQTLKDLKLRSTQTDRQRLNRFNQLQWESSADDKEYLLKRK